MSDQIKQIDKKGNKSGKTLWDKAVQKTKKKKTTDDVLKKEDEKETGDLIDNVFYRTSESANVFPYIEKFQTLHEKTSEKIDSLDMNSVLLLSKRLKELIPNLEIVNNQFKKLPESIENIDFDTKIEIDNVIDSGSKVYEEIEKIIKDLEKVNQLVGSLVSLKTNFSKTGKLFNQHLTNMVGYTNQIAPLIQAHSIQTILYFTGDNRKVDVCDNLSVNMLPVTVTRWDSFNKSKSNPLDSVLNTKISNVSTQDFTQEIDPGEEYEGDYNLSDDSDE
jgi:hypothetical protein